MSKFLRVLVYAFNAANGDTTLSANRINDCVRNGTVDPIEFIVNVDITSGSHSCGAAVVNMHSFMSGFNEK